MSVTHETPPPPPPPYGVTTTASRAARRSLSVGLSGTLQGFLWAVAGLAGVASVFALVALGTFQTYWDTRPGSSAERQAFEDWIAADDGRAGAVFLMWLAHLVAFILLLIWMNHAHKVTQQLWRGERSWSSGWTIGGWFIPVAQFFIPKAVLNEIERISLCARRYGVASPSWRQQSTAATGWVWWVAFIAGALLHAIGGQVGIGAESSSDAVVAGYALQAIGLALISAGSVCGALYVRRIGRALTAEAFGVRTPPLTTFDQGELAEVEVCYSTATWSTAQLDEVTRSLQKRGVRFRTENGELVVDKPAENVTDAVVAECTQASAR